MEEPSCSIEMQQLIYEDEAVPSTSKTEPKTKNDDEETALFTPLKSEQPLIKSESKTSISLELVCIYIYKICSLII